MEDVEDNGRPLLAVTYPSAQQLADLKSVELDLMHVVQACRRLLDELTKPERDAVLIQALWTSALVAYARCFGTGKREALAKDVLDGLEGAHEAHAYFKSLRDKHIAHSVNPFEGMTVGLILSDDSPPSVEMILTFGFKSVSDGEGVKSLLYLASQLGREVTRRAELKTPDVLSDAQALSPEELSQLRVARHVAPPPTDAGKARR